MKVVRQIFIVAVLTVVGMGGVNQVFAPPPPPPPPASGAPIDAYAALLILLGLIVGIRHLLKAR